MTRPLVTSVASSGLGLLALAASLWLGHPWSHAVLIGLGAGCVAFALGSWWASRVADGH